jgi:beta-N-acetylhexosaminidase
MCTGNHPMNRNSAAILGVEGPVLSAAEADFFRQANPWGFILFARNVVDPAQLRQLSADLRAAVGRNAPILIDQEGGRVQRLTPPHWHQHLPPLDQVEAAGPASERAIWLRGRLIAHELRGCGIDVNCAPCADLASDSTHVFLRNRCYGSDVATVVQNARAMAEGQFTGGVLPVLKHIPGHGRATVDSHKDLPRVTASRQHLEGTDFATFRALSDLPMAMTAHIVFEEIDPERPATQSAAMVALIRSEIGFGGLLISDDISMQALSGDVAARSRASLAAGCDLVLHCNGDLKEMKAVVEAAGDMSGAAEARAEKALLQRQVPDPIDIKAARAELQSLSMAKQG